MLFYLFFGGFADEAVALMALPGAEHRLELTQADMLDYGSLVEVFMGCDAVFHTSSPSDLVSNYPVRTSPWIISFLSCKHVVAFFFFF